MRALIAAALAVLSLSACVTLPRGTAAPSADDCAIVTAILARPEVVAFPSEFTAFTDPGNRYAWDTPNPDPVDLRLCPGLETQPALGQTWTLWPPRITRTLRDDIRAFSRPVVIGDEASVELNHPWSGIIFQLRRSPAGVWTVVSAEEWSNEIIV